MKNLLNIIFVIISTNLLLFPQTNVQGDIYNNTTWTLNGSPYNLTGNVRVRSGVTLTIQNGVQVNLQGKTIYIGYGSYNESGSLQANGVTFSSSGTYKGLIIFESSSLGSITGCSFSNTNIEFRDNSGPTFSGNTLDVNSSIYISSQEVIPNISTNNVFNSQKIYLGAFTISSNKTLKNFTNCTYYLVGYSFYGGDIRVRGGATLTIESGSKVNLQGNTIYIGSDSYNEFGILHANGVTFEANNGRLRFENTSIISLSHCNFNYQVIIEIIKFNSFTIRNSSIGQFCTLSNSFSDTVDARNNFWGSSLGPRHSSNPGGTGTIISGRVKFVPFLTAPITSVELDNSLPEFYELYPNYPNPFNPTTTIEFDLPERSHVRLTVYDVLGREVKKLVDEEMNAGKYKINFEASDLSSGIYFYVINTDKYNSIKKMILIK